MTKTEGHHGFHFQNKHIPIAVMLLAIIAILVWLLWPQVAATISPAAKKTLAQCLTEKGVVMYGVDTCTNCQAQKELFGDDFADIDYVNCDFNEDACRDRGITFYPVWSHENSVLIGTQTLKELAIFAGCKI